MTLSCELILHTLNASKTSSMRPASNTTRSSPLWTLHEPGRFGSHKPHIAAVGNNADEATADVVDELREALRESNLTTGVLCLAVHDHRRNSLKPLQAAGTRSMVKLFIVDLVVHCQEMMCKVCR